MAQPSHIAGFLSLWIMCCLIHCSARWGIYYHYLWRHWIRNGCTLRSIPPASKAAKAPNWWHWGCHLALGSWWSRWEFSLAVECHTTFLPSGECWGLAGSLLKQSPDSSSPCSGYTPPVADWTLGMYLNSAPACMYKLTGLLIYWH